MTMYRAFPIDETGRVFGPPREFEVQTDIEAIAQAARFGDSCVLEVWSFARRVGRVEPGSPTKH